MGSINYAGTPLVSASMSSYLFGDSKFIMGGVDGEYYPFSIPGASGTGETFSGNRQRIHGIEIRWFTIDPNTLKDLVDGYQQNPAYALLQVVRRTWTRNFPSCRVFRVEWIDEQGGVRADGQACTVIDARIFFLQVK